MAKKQQKSAAPQAPRAAAASNVKSKRRTRFSLQGRALAWCVYGGGFLLWFLFLTFVYGDMFVRAVQESYVSSSADTMYYIVSSPFGYLYWAGRYLLLVCRWAASAGAFLSLVFTLTALVFDRLLRLPSRWWGTGYVLAAGCVAWMIVRGTNLYFMSEPSLVVLIPVGVLLLTALLAGVAALVARLAKRPAAASVPAQPLGLLLTLLLVAGATVAARTVNANEMLTARVQNLADEQRWDEIIEAARQADRPTRTVAAYHAIALLQTDQLLDGLFDIPYDFPKARLDSLGGNDEYNLLLAPCNFYAGLTNAAYRCAMDRVVTYGPSLSSFKLMVRCALVAGERELCDKYLDLVAMNPGEDKFVQEYRAMLADSTLLQQNDDLRRVMSRLPLEKNFEQNYMPPAFLGYNLLLQQGTDATLITSVAACLYTKDLQSLLPRVRIMQQKGVSLPACVLQALAIMSLKQPALLQEFPQVAQYAQSQVRAFLLDAKPYVKDRLALRHELKKDWLGAYVYYYYTENNDPDQVRKPQTQTDSHGVN